MKIKYFTGSKKCREGKYAIRAGYYLNIILAGMRLSRLRDARRRQVANGDDWPDFFAAALFPSYYQQRAILKRALGRRHPRLRPVFTSVN